jgi:hypothetical protein
LILRNVLTEGRYPDFAMFSSLIESVISAGIVT